MRIWGARWHLNLSRSTSISAWAPQFQHNSYHPRVTAYFGGLNRISNPSLSFQLGGMYKKYILQERGGGILNVAGAICHPVYEVTSNNKIIITNSQWSCAIQIEPVWIVYVVWSDLSCLTTQLVASYLNYTLLLQCRDFPKRHSQYKDYIVGLLTTHFVTTWSPFIGD